MIFMDYGDSLTDKLKKLEKAYAAKQLSEREYEMWKRVYQASADMMENQQSSVSSRKRRRLR